MAERYFGAGQIRELRKRAQWRSVVAEFGEIAAG